jgi:hypothetical protein
MTIGIFKECLVKYFFVHKIVFKAILVFEWMRSNLELLPVINVKSRPRYISALKKVVPDVSRPKKSRHYFDALNDRVKIRL